MFSYVYYSAYVCLCIASTMVERRKETPGAKHRSVEFSNRIARFRSLRQDWISEDMRIGVGEDCTLKSDCKCVLWNPSLLGEGKRARKCMSCF